MKQIVARDLTPDGTVTVWRIGSKLEMEDDGTWDSHDKDYVGLIGEYSHNEFRMEFGLELDRGALRVLSVDWAEE